jgi:hypothetical protein
VQPGLRLWMGEHWSVWWLGGVHCVGAVCTLCACGVLSVCVPQCAHGVSKCDVCRGLWCVRVNSMADKQSWLGSTHVRDAVPHITTAWTSLLL